MNEQSYSSSSYRSITLWVAGLIALVLVLMAILGKGFSNNCCGDMAAKVALPSPAPAILSTPVVPEATNAALATPPMAAIQAKNEAQLKCDNALKEPIQFGSGGAVLSPAAQLELKVWADCTKGKKITLTGNSDNTGDEGFNVILSKQRAEAAKNVMVQAGSAAADVATAGVGSAKPLADNATEAGRLKNRRLDIAVQ